MLKLKKQQKKIYWKLDASIIEKLTVYFLETTSQRSINRRRQSFIIYFLQIKRKEHMDWQKQSQIDCFRPPTQNEKEKILKEKLFLKQPVLCKVVSHMPIFLKMTTSFLILAKTEEQEDVDFIHPLTNINLRFKIRYPDQKTHSSFQESKILQSISFQLKINDLVLCQIEGINPMAQEHILSTFKKRLPQQGLHGQFSEKKIAEKKQHSTLFIVKKKHDKKSFIMKAFSKKFLLENDEYKHADEMLLNQLDILRSLEHKNIARLEGVSSSNNTIYVIYENIGSKNLLDFLNIDFSKATTQEIACCLAEILEGLRYLNKKRIAHRDLKPANIVLRNSKLSTPVIIDFQLAINCEMQNYETIRCGTPGYIAPEILRNTTNAPIDPVCDIFSAGVIFYNLLTGQALFKACLSPEVTQQNENYSNKVLLDKLPTLKLNPFAEDLLIKMLEEDPVKRITADQALQHPFFKQGNPENHETMELIQANTP